jgi:hypothetical protein
MIVKEANGAEIRKTKNAVKGELANSLKLNVAVFQAQNQQQLK